MFVIFFKIWIVNFGLGKGCCCIIFFGKLIEWLMFFILFLNSLCKGLINLNFKFFGKLLILWWFLILIVICFLVLGLIFVLVDLIMFG